MPTAGPDCDPPTPAPARSDNAAGASWPWGECATAAVHGTVARTNIYGSSAASTAASVSSGRLVYGAGSGCPRPRGDMRTQSRTRHADHGRDWNCGPVHKAKRVWGIYKFQKFSKSLNSDFNQFKFLSISKNQFLFKEKTFLWSIRGKSGESKGVP